MATETLIIPHLDEPELWQRCDAELTAGARVITCDALVRFRDGAAQRCSRCDTIREPSDKALAILQAAREIWQR